MLAFIVGLVPVKGLLDCYSFQRRGWACFPSQGCNYQEECLTYTWIFISVTNICSVVSLIMYLTLFYKARKLRNKVDYQPDVSSADERTATARKLKQERRANVTFFLLYLALIGVSLPSVITLFIGRALVTGGTTLPMVYNVVEILAGSSFPLLTFIDPLVIMRNEDFREAIKGLFNKLKPRTSETPTELSATVTSPN